MFALATQLVTITFMASMMALAYCHQGVRRGDYSEVLGGLYAPFILFVLYGLIPLQVYFRPRSELFVDPLYYNLSFFLISIGGITYFIGFNCHKLIGAVQRQARSQSTEPGPIHKVIFLVLATLDLYARLTSIYEGTYFYWMAAAIRLSGQFEPGALHFIMRGTGPLLGALALYLASRSIIYRIYFVIIFALVLLEGNRGVLTYFLIATTLAWVHKRQENDAPTLRLVMALGLLFVGYKFVESMRAMLALSGTDATSDPVLFLFEATKISLFSIAGLSSDIPILEYQGSGLSERTLAWANTFAFQVAAAFSGTEPIGITGIMRELSSIIPRVFWIAGEKPDLATGSILAEHFGTRDFTSDDPATTSFSSAYLFGGSIGLVVFSFMFGVVQRFVLEVCKFCFGEYGKFLYIGSVAFIVVRANSFSGAFAGVRNFLIILTMAVLFSIILRSVAKTSRKMV